MKKKSSEKSLCYSSYKVTNFSSHKGLEKFPFFQDAKYWSQNLIVFDQIVKAELSSYLYFLKLSFIWFNWSYLWSKPHLKVYFSVWFMDSFPLCPFPTFSMFSPSLIQNIYNSHLFHGSCGFLWNNFFCNDIYQIKFLLFTWKNCHEILYYWKINIFYW